MDRHLRLSIGDGDPPTAPTVVATAGCTGGSCPTVYRTASGTYLVQGRTISAGSVGLDVPADEALVEIPASLVAELIDGGRRAQ